MVHIRSVVGSLVSVLGVLSIAIVALAPTHSTAALAAGVAVVFLAAMLASEAAALTSLSRGSRARSTAFVRRQETSADPSPQHPDTAGRPRTRAPSEGSRA